MFLIDPIYWKWLFPEIACFPHRDNRMRALARALNLRFALFSFAPVYILLCFLIVCLVIGGAARFQVTPFVHPIVVLVASAIVSAFVTLAVWRPVLRRTLRGILRDAGCCERCGYDLFLTQTQRCPECGLVREEPVAPTAYYRMMYME